MGVRIDVDNITFSYDPESVKPVFENVSFDVNDGEVLSLLGPNGTGKSTLLKCMAGLLTPFCGNVILDGFEVRSMKHHEVARKVGYVPQTQVSQFPFMVHDIVLMGRASHLGTFSVPKEEDEVAAEKALEKVGMQHLSDRTCTGISGGEWQLVLIARAIAQNPDILLLDEPTSHLDLGNQMRVLEVISGLAEEGITTVVATHFPDHAFLTSDRVAILKDRMILDIGEPDRVISEDNMKSAYGVDVSIMQLDDPVNRKVCVPLTCYGRQKENDSC